VYPFSPKLDHNVARVSERVFLTSRISSTRARTSEKWLSIESFHASKMYAAVYFLSLTRRRVKPGPIGVICTPGPFQFFANSANSKEFTDLLKLIETPSDFIRL